MKTFLNLFVGIGCFVAVCGLLIFADYGEDPPHSPHHPYRPIPGQGARDGF